MRLSVSVPVGSKIYFAEEIHTPYEVMAVSGHFAICTRKYWQKKTVWYTVIDTERNVRGTLNYVFSPFNMESKADIKKAIAELVKGECEVGRNRIELLVYKVIPPVTKRRKRS